jgi:hypothetical protein
MHARARELSETTVQASEVSRGDQLTIDAELEALEGFDGWDIFDVARDSGRSLRFLSLNGERARA